MYILGPTAMPPSDGTNNYTTIFSLDDGSSATWTASAGTPTTGSGAFFGIWTTPNAPGTTVRITATSGGVTVILDIIITSADFPYAPSIVVEGTVDDVTLLHTMENGARRGRRKTGVKGAWDLTFKNRTLTEYNDVISKFDQLGKLLPFAMNDPITGLKVGWYFDSAINRQYGGRSCGITYAFKVKQA